MNEVEKIYALYLASDQKISTDTRKIEKGSIFFALSGKNFDGNQFAEEAIEKGARYAVVDDKNLLNKPKMIVVDNVLETLQLVSKHHRQTLNLPIIAITGTNGKTTTKELLNVVLSKKFSVTSTIGNLNNHIGIPLTLLTIKPFDDIAIIEMGANHTGEIASYCQYVLPDYGLITNVGKAHIEGFGSVEKIKEGKSELYRYLASNEKIIFLHYEDSVLTSLVPSNARIEYYTTKEFHQTTVEIDPTAETLSIKITDNEIITYLNTKLIGDYNVSNVMAAFSIGQYFDVPTDDIKEAIESYIPKNNRSQVITKGSNKIYLDAYNANPSSMKVAIDNFKKLDGKKVAILGAMKELGNASEDEHNTLIDYVNSQNFETIVLVGDEYDNSQKSDNILLFKEFDKLKKWFDSQNWVNTNVLIKGSRANALERLVE